MGFAMSWVAWAIFGLGLACVAVAAVAHDERGRYQWAARAHASALDRRLLGLSFVLLPLGIVLTVALH